jgi:putative DNA methylase
MDAKSFIEAQFPVSKVSKESYKERKATNSQTLTGLGKWWGRKPLILVRAAILGLLLPATDKPETDREVFLKLLTMDEEGLWLRKTKAIPLKIVWERLTPSERRTWFTSTSSDDKPKLKKEKKPEREALQSSVFRRFRYDEKLEYCERPENVEGPSEEAWGQINAHLGTMAEDLPGLVEQLSVRHFGHRVRVGDTFSGGGSVPFEAARIGCDSFGSDLSPVATLLSWAALNIIGGGPDVVDQTRQAQRSVYDSVDHQVVGWGIEHNESGDRADAFLYCVETRCPECGWTVPLMPSRVIGLKDNTIAQLIPDAKQMRFGIDIISDVSGAELKRADEYGTARDSDLVCPNPDCEKSTPITMIRGDRRSGNGAEYGLRMWENEDVAPRPGDVFQERLYCIRWVHRWVDADGKEQTERYFRAPNQHDTEREGHVSRLLKERFSKWQANGFIPKKRIEPGEKTDEPIRTRGWTHWHHLFNPRQLLILGTLMEETARSGWPQAVAAAMLLGMSRCADYNARLSRWHPRSIGDKSEQTFSNQALNTMLNYATRPLSSLGPAFFLDINGAKVIGDAAIWPEDARRVTQSCDFWITDPPYADAINYHELSEFFLAWYADRLHTIFPNWYTDSKRALAVQGAAEGFRRNMVDCYRNLASHMPDNGAQIVMFTHQDASVWADLALILWASGLRVTAAWCIATETDTAMREGNYVQGTVLLVVRKQTSNETAFLDEVVPQVEDEVKSQLDSMLKLDDEEDPNFGDTDYQLAAYAAALRVLTKYKSIEDIDVSYELSKTRKKGEESPIAAVIFDAVKTACDHLVPKGFDQFTWKTLTPEERFYLKGLDLESHQEFRTSAYMELARGFGVRDYKSMLSSGKANQTRLKTASEFEAKVLGDSEFGMSLVRNTLFATREALRQNEAQAGRNWLKTELPDYWSHRKSMIIILRYLSSMELKVSGWKNDGHAAGLVAGALENDSV